MLKATVHTKIKVHVFPCIFCYFVSGLFWCKVLINCRDVCLLYNIMELDATHSTKNHSGKLNSRGFPRSHNLVPQDGLVNLVSQPQLDGSAFPNLFICSYLLFVPCCFKHHAQSATYSHSTTVERRQTSLLLMCQNKLGFGVNWPFKVYSK